MLCIRISKKHLIQLIFYFNNNIVNKVSQILESTRCFQSCLTDWYRSVKLSAASHKYQFSSDDPQGSLLSLFRFKLFVKDISSWKTPPHLTIVVDEVKIFHFGDIESRVSRARYSWRSTLRAGSRCFIKKTTLTKIWMSGFIIWGRFLYNGFHEYRVL